MLSLLRMHWTANRRILFQILPLFAFWILAFFRSEATMEAAAIHYFSILVALTQTAEVLLQGLNTPLEPFLLALPVHRNQVVGATYLVSLGAAALGVVVPQAVYALATRRAVDAGLPALLLGGLEAGIMAYLPLRFHLGGSRGLTVFAGILLAACIGIYVGTDTGGFQVLLVRGAGACAAHPAFALAGLLAFGAASFLASCAAYARREF